MSQFEINGTKIYYEIHGEGEPLLVVPGGGVDGRYYEAIVKLLAKQFKVIVPDPRGAGRSEKGVEPYSFNLLADDMVALLNHLKINSAYVLGHSMGGMVAQHLAYTHPEYVKKLVLYATASSMSGFGKHCSRTFAVVKATGSLEAFVHVFSIWNFTDHFLADPNNIKAIVEGLKNDPYPAVDKNIEEQMVIINEFDSSAQLKDIKASTLVLCNEKDIIFPAAMMQALTSRIPHAQFKMLVDGAHSYHVENPELVAKVIEDFLKG